MGNVNNRSTVWHLRLNSACSKLQVVLKKEWLGVKWSVLRTLVEIRAYVNTDKGEATLVRTLTTILVLGIVDICLLIVGTIFA